MPLAVALVLALTFAAGPRNPPAAPRQEEPAQATPSPQAHATQARQASLALGALVAVLAGLGIVAFTRGRRIAAPLEKRIFAATLRQAGRDGRVPLRGKSP